MKLSELTWDEFHVYLAVDRKISEKASSISANKSRFKKLQEWFGDKDLTRSNFNDFMVEMIQEGYSNSYKNNMIKIAKQISRYLQLTDMMDYTYFREPKRIPKDVLTASEIESLANVELSYRNNRRFLNARQKAIILLLGTTGCRIGELLSLTWDDIGTTSKYAYVTFRDTKNGDDRTNVLGRMAYDAIFALPRLADKIFVSYRGGRLQSQEIDKDLKARARAVGIQKNVYCHLCRASVVTELLQDGMELSDVSEIVGHRDPRTTLRYKHATLDHYYNAMMVHPLLKDDMTWELQEERIRKGIAKLVATRFEVSVSYGENQITVVVSNRQG